jgi:hypothetical protein
MFNPVPAWFLLYESQILSSLTTALLSSLFTLTVNPTCIGGLWCELKQHPKPRFASFKASDNWIATLHAASNTGRVIRLQS